MNKNKIVEMYCSNCNKIIGKQPTIVIQKDGSSKIEERQPKNCPECKSGLQRHVTKIKKER